MRPQSSMLLDLDARLAKANTSADRLDALVWWIEATLDIHGARFDNAYIDLLGRDWTALQSRRLKAGER